MYGFMSGLWDSECVCASYFASVGAVSLTETFLMRGLGSTAYPSMFTFVIFDGRMLNEMFPFCHIAIIIGLITLVEAPVLPFQA